MGTQTATKDSLLYEIVMYRIHRELYI